MTLFKISLPGLLLLGLLFFACTATKHPLVARPDSLPSDTLKIAPADDPHPPLLHSNDYETPIPLATISTKGAEDSPFIPADKKELFSKTPPC